MVDSLSPLPPLNARVTKTQVSEKNPHHQNNPQHKKETQDEEIKDEVIIENPDEEIITAENKKNAYSNPQHNIDIEV